MLFLKDFFSIIAVIHINKSFVPDDVIDYTRHYEPAFRIKQDKIKSRKVRHFVFDKKFR